MTKLSLLSSFKSQHKAGSFLKVASSYFPQPWVPFTLSSCIALRVQNFLQDSSRSQIIIIIIIIIIIYCIIIIIIIIITVFVNFSLKFLDRISFSKILIFQFSVIVKSSLHFAKGFLFNCKWLIYSFILYFYYYYY